MKSTPHSVLPEMVSADSLLLGDIVRSVPNSAYGTATVKQIKDGWITLFRPYVKTEDFSYTGGVICYVGIEEYKIPANKTQWELLGRAEELK